MDKTKVKEMLAKHGLIILSCILLGFAILATTNFIPRINNKHVYRCSVGGKDYRINIKNYVAPSSWGVRGKFKAFIYFSVKYPEDFAVENKSFVPSDFEIKYVGKRKDLNRILYILGITAIFALYPAYLLILFTKWAVKTVREP